MTAITVKPNGMPATQAACPYPSAKTPRYVAPPVSAWTLAGVAPNIAAARAIAARMPPTRIARPRDRPAPDPTNACTEPRSFPHRRTATDWTVVLVRRTPRPQAARLPPAGLLAFSHRRRLPRHGAPAGRGRPLPSSPAHWAHTRKVSVGKPKKKSEVVGPSELAAAQEPPLPAQDARVVVPVTVPVTHRPVRLLVGAAPEEVEAGGSVGVAVAQDPPVAVARGAGGAQAAQPAGGVGAVAVPVTHQWHIGGDAPEEVDIDSTRGVAVAQQPPVGPQEARGVVAVAVPVTHQWAVGGGAEG